MNSYTLGLRKYLHPEQQARGRKNHELSILKKRGFSAETMVMHHVPLGHCNEHSAYITLLLTVATRFYIRTPQCKSLYANSILLSHRIL